MKKVFGNVLERVGDTSRTLKRNESKSNNLIIPETLSPPKFPQIDNLQHLESPRAPPVSDERSPFVMASPRRQTNVRQSVYGINLTSARKISSKSRSTTLFRQFNDGRLEKSYKQARLGASVYVPMQKSNATPLVHELNILLANMTTEQRLKKAARHLDDALKLRSVRHDIDTSDSKLLRFCYFLQTQKKWQSFLYFLTWAFLLITFFEPPCSGDDDFFKNNPNNFIIVVSVESAVMVAYLFELFMEIFHRYHDPRTFKNKFLKNKALLGKVFFNFIFLLDLIIFYAFLPNVVFRFSRPLRPFCLALYSKQLRRTFFGILKSIGHMFDILLFFVIITVIYAAIGLKVIGDLGGADYDKYASNFKDFGPSVNALYILFSRDNYPDIMLPALNESYYYLFYFIPFMVINTLLFVPIPIAVIFDAFRSFRSKLVVSERIKEREALVACFLSLDIDGNGSISKDEFVSLCQVAYNKQFNEEKVDEIFEFLDEKSTNNLKLEDFFFIVEVMEDTKNLKKPYIPEIKIWNLIRRKINAIFKFDKIIQHYIFEFAIMGLILVNTVLLIYSMFETNSKKLAVIDTINDVFQYLYIAEIVMKIMGLGVYKYFTDKWNIFDFTLTLVTQIFNIAFSFVKVARTAKAGRLLRISKAQSLFRVIAAFRGAKLFRCFYYGLRSLNRIKRFIKDLMLCFPIVLKLTAVLFMITYLYAVIGMEIFNSKEQIHESSPYIAAPYASFDNFGGALLILFELIVQAQWSSQVYDWAYRFDSLTKSSFYFNTFCSITNYFIISLLTGLIWEVFTYMEKQFEQQDQIDAKLDEIYFEDPEKIQNARRARKSGRYVVGDMSISELDFDHLNPENTFLAAVKRSKSLNPLDLAISSSFEKKLSNNDLSFRQQQEIISPIDPIPSNSLKASDTLNTKRTLHIPSKFKLQNERKNPSKTESIIRLLGPSPRDEYEEKNSEISQYLDQIEDKTLDHKKIPTVKINEKEIENEMLELLESPEQSPGLSLSDVIKNSKVKTHAFESWPISNQNDGGGLVLEPKSKTEYVEEPDTKSCYSLEKCLSTRRRLPSRVPSLNIGDSHPVRGETEKTEPTSSSHNDDDNSQEYNVFGLDFKSAEVPVPRRIERNSIRGNSLVVRSNISKVLGNDWQMSAKLKPTAFRKKDTQFSKKMGRSDSLDTTQKPSQIINSIPIVNQIFINDRQPSDTREVEPSILFLEKEFFVRKIFVCQHVSDQKNQFEYVSGNIEKRRNKFKHEVKLLRLNSNDSDDSDEEDKLKKNGNIDDAHLSEVKTKYLENLKKRMQQKMSQPGDRILRKALLHSQDQDSIQKFEDEHFIEMYGKWFEYLKNPKIEKIRDVFEIENKILVRFMRLMRQDEIVSKDFVEITYMIEESINKNLLRKGSLSKFLFKDQKGKWFFIFKQRNKFRIQYLSSGFWSYSDDLFTDKSKLYEGQDILYPGKNRKFETPAEDFYSVLAQISKKLQRSTLHNCEKDEGLWNMYAIPFQTSSVKQLKLNALKAVKTKSKIDITNLQDTIVTEGVFFSVNYIMSAHEARGANQELQRMNTSQLIDFEKSRKTALQEGYERLVQLERQPVRRSSLSVNTSGPNSTLTPDQKRDIQRLEEKVFTINPRAPLPKSETNFLIPSSSGKHSNVENFLPLHEYIDFMRDLRDALNLYKDHFLLKFSSFYSELHAKVKT